MQSVGIFQCKTFSQERHSSTKYAVRRYIPVPYRHAQGGARGEPRAAVREGRGPTHGVAPFEPRVPVLELVGVIDAVRILRLKPRQNPLRGGPLHTDVRGPTPRPALVEILR